MSREKILEAALIEFYMRELEGTIDDFFQSRIAPPTPKERTVFRYALWRLREKGIIESIGYHGNVMNYRVTETVLARGLTTKRRGCYGINKQDHGDSQRIEPSGPRREPASLRG